MTTMAMTLTLLASLAALAAAAPPGSRFLEDAEQAAGRLMAGIDPSDILKQFDPYTIDKVDVDLKQPEITASGSVEKLVISGISRLKLGRLAWSMPEGKASIEIMLPSIDAVGQYSVDGKLSASGINLPLQGKGPVTAGLTDLTAKVSIDLGISNKGQILLEDFQWSWNMTDIQLHLDGLYGGLALGKMINKILADILPHLVIKAYHDQITEAVTTAVMTKGAAYLLALHKDHAEPQPYGWADTEAALIGDDSARIGGLAARDGRLQLRADDDDLEDSLQAVDGEVLADLDADTKTVRVELRGEARLLPPGTLASDFEELSGPEPAENLESLVLSMLRAGADGEGAVEVKLDGQPRFFPAGTLAVDQEEEDDILDEPVGLLGADAVNTAILVKLDGQPRFFPAGSLAVVEPKEEPVGLLNVDTAVRVELVGQPKYFPAGALASADFDEEDTHAIVVRRLLSAEAESADLAAEELSEENENSLEDEEDFVGSSPEDEQ